MTSSILHPIKIMVNDATPRSILLIRAQDGPAITISSLLLSCVKDVPVIITAAHAKLILTLQLIVVFIAQEVLTAQDNLHGKLSNSEGVRASTNNFNDSKISLYLCKDCGIFCEGEWRQHDDANDNGIVTRQDISLLLTSTQMNGLVGRNGGINGLTVNHTGVNGFTGLIGQTYLNGLIGPVGQICSVDQTRLLSLIDPMGIVG
jgi:hypothetical protein